VANCGAQALISSFGYGIDIDPLTAFGLIAVSLMLLFYALERRGRWTILAFAGACALASAYSFLQGAWPFGIVEAVWSVVALRRRWTMAESVYGGGLRCHLLSSLNRPRCTIV